MLLFWSLILLFILLWRLRPEAQYSPLLNLTQGLGQSWCEILEDRTQRRDRIAAWRRTAVENRGALWREPGAEPELQCVGGGPGVAPDSVVIRISFTPGGEFHVLWKQKKRKQTGGPGPDLDLSSCSLHTQEVRCDPDPLSWVDLVLGRVPWTMVEEMEGKDKPRPSPDYLMQLMNDKKLMSSLPNFCGIFQHLERLLDEGKIRTPSQSVSLSGTVPVWKTENCVQIPQ